MELQKTIAKEISFSGVGLHTGNKTTVTFKPAEENKGACFIRTDLPERPTIKVSVDNVSEYTRETALGRGEAEVHTVEHLLAALGGLGIDNIISWMNAESKQMGRTPNGLFAMVKYQVDTKEVRDSSKDKYSRNAVFRVMKDIFKGFVCDTGVKEKQSLRFSKKTFDLVI